MTDLSGRTTIVVVASCGRPRDRRGPRRCRRPGGCGIGGTAATFPEPASGVGTIHPGRLPMAVTRNGGRQPPRPLRARRRHLWWPVQARTCVRCSSRSCWRRSRSTGRPTSELRSNWSARRCCSCSGPAAEWSCSAAEPRQTGHRSAEDTPAPRPPSASSQGTPRTRPTRAGLDITFTAALPPFRAGDPTSADRPSRPTRLAPARPLDAVPPAAGLRWSPRRSPALLGRAGTGEMPPPSPPSTG